MWRQLLWSFLAKLAALVLLWLLFFSGRHALVTPQSLSQQFGLTTPAATRPSPP